MRAIVMTEFGDPQVLQPVDVPAPVAAAGEVVIAVEFANVTFVETQLRAGRPPHPSMLPALPVILGNGVGGTVAELGAGVDRELAGRRVVASLSGRGGYAERAVADAQRLVEVPASLPLRDAVALLADGRTALALTRLAGVTEGDTVLVEAAAGGVGTLLLQFSRNAGARVVALAGGERKLRLARDLGADVVADYTQAGWERQVRAAAGPVQVVFDGVGGDVGLAASGLLAPGGRFCPFGMASGAFAPVTPELARASGITVLRGAVPAAAELTALVADVLAEAAAGRVRPVIGQEFSLARAAAAHAAIEGRLTIGKTLLAIG